MNTINTIIYSLIFVTFVLIVYLEFYPIIRCDQTRFIEDCDEL